MQHKEFLELLDESRIVAAIQAAELKTSGEIRVFVSRKPAEDPVVAARLHFNKLGMHKTALRNGVLIFMAPKSQKFAIVGDQGVHQHCGDVFWQETAQAMTDLLKQGQFTEAIVAGISRAGEVLARYFPRQHDDQNELPDTVVGD